MSGSETRQRTELTAVRMTPDEKRQLLAAAAARGVSASRFIREAAITQADSLQERP